MEENNGLTVVTPRLNFVIHAVHNFFVNFLAFNFVTSVIVAQPAERDSSERQFNIEAVTCTNKDCMYICLNKFLTENSQSFCMPVSWIRNWAKIWLHCIPIAKQKFCHPLSAFDHLCDIMSIGWNSYPTLPDIEDNALFDPARNPTHWSASGPEFKLICVFLHLVTKLVWAQSSSLQHSCKNHFA